MNKNTPMTRTEWVEYYQKENDKCAQLYWEAVETYGPGSAAAYQANIWFSNANTRLNQAKIAYNDK